MVKEFLSQKGIGFTEKDVNLDRAAAAELFRLTRQMAVPVTVIDGQAVIGFDRGRLESILVGKTRPSLGAAVADASKINLKKSLPVTTGAYIGSVKPGSVAYNLGLAVGDIIVEVNSQHVSGADDLERLIASLRPGNCILVVILRDGSRRAIEGTI
jgi:glutaredoxin 3